MQREVRRRPRGQKKSRKYPLKKILGYGGIAALSLVLGLCIYSIVGLHLANDDDTQGSPSNCSQVGVPGAAIVDHLGLSQPNEAFVEESTALLDKAGFEVDYYPGDLVTVDFYRDLPTHCYRLLILRVHSATYASQTPREQVLDFFTSENYSSGKYVREQEKNQLRQVAFMPYNDGDRTYFGITSEFVLSCMNGKFNNTLVIMMGCDGLKLNYDEMAEAFIQKGAQVYIGWSGLVSGPHTDQVTIDLLRRLLTAGQTVEDAIAGTMNTLGADPSYESLLSYYPAERGNCTVL